MYTCIFFIGANFSARILFLTNEKNTRHHRHAFMTCELNFYTRVTQKANGLFPHAEWPSGPLVCF